MIQQRAMLLVAALRSGKYKQTPGRLRKGNSFCCLGVACDVADKPGWESDSFDDDNSIYTHRFGASVSLPLSVQRYFAFNTAYGHPQNNQRIVIPGRPISYVSLEEANDDGCTFAQIADYIETHWEIL